MTTDVMAVGGLYNVEQTAGVLNTSPIAVRRLIARGRLKATRLKTTDASDGPYKILFPNVQAYIAASAPDLQTPKLDSAGGDGVSPTWFADEFNWMRQPLADALAKESESQKLSDSAYAAAIAGRDGFTESMIIDVQLTDAMRRLLGGPVYPGRPKVPGAAEPPFESWGGLWLAYAMRNGVGSRISVGNHGTTSPILTFFDSPQSYEQLVEAAIQDTLAASFFAWSEYRPRPNSSNGELPDGGTFRIIYRLRVTTWATAASLRQLADRSAF